MPTFAAWLLELAWPVVKRVLVALGIGAISYSGLSLLGSQVQGLVQGYWGGLPAVALQLLTLGGFSQAVGILLGALSARIALVAVGRIGKLAA